MKILALIAALILIPFSDLHAALQTIPVRNRMTIVHLDNAGIQSSRRHRVRRVPTSFHVYVISDSDGIKGESFKNGRPFIAALRDERFAVRLHNPLPVRVAVNLTIDGLNSISGKPSGIADGQKWLIDPYSSMTIRGWQVSGGEARRFYFTDKPKSYAAWTGERMDKDLSINCGVIGAAYFWSQKELDRYYDEHPEYRYHEETKSLMEEKAFGLARESSQLDVAQLRAPAAAPIKEQEAGTGMGERESHPTTLVDFDYDTGMYQSAQAVMIYYDFLSSGPTPNPFPAISFAPEMP